MQIVIDIDVDFYDKFIYGDDVTDDDFNKVADIMASGIPLPTGHGRLIDADKLPLNDIDNANYGSNYIRIAPTVLEADMRGDTE